MYKKIIIILIFIIIFFSSMVYSQLLNSPWPMFLHDPQHTSRSTNRFAKSGNGTKGRPVWKFYTEDDLSSSTVIDAEGKIYFTTYDGNLYSVNPDGTLNWKIKPGEGINSTPCIDKNGNIYIVDHNGDLYSISETGGINWKINLSAPGNYFSAPVIWTNGKIYTSTDYLFCITNGNIEWSYWFDVGKIVSPTIGKYGNIYAAELHGHKGRTLYSIKPDGTTNWVFCSGSGGTMMYPAVDKKGNIYIEDYDEDLYSLDTNGNTNWSYSLEPGSAPDHPAIGIDHQGRLLVGTRTELVCINTNGTFAWEYWSNLGFDAAPLIDGDGDIFIFGARPLFFCISSSGGCKWTIPVPENDWDSFRGSPAMDTNGKIYFSCSDVLYCIKMNDKPQISITNNSNKGLIPVQYDLTDLNNDLCSIEVKYSLNGGINWSDCTTEGTITNISQASNLIVYWDSKFDVPYNTNVRLKIIVFDGYDYVDSNILDFALKNNIYAKLQDSPWPVYRHDLKHTGRTPYKFSDSGTGKVIRTNWKFKCDGSIYSSAAIDKDGKIYFGCSFGILESSEGYFYSLDPDGTLNWKFKADSGIMSSPCIMESGHVFFICNNSPPPYDPSEGYLYCLNPDGTLRWKKLIHNQPVSYSSPIVTEEGEIILAVGAIGYGYQTMVYSFNVNGKTNWTCLPLGSANSLVNNSPAVDNNGFIYITSEDSWLNKIDKNGNLVEWFNYDFDSTKGDYTTPSIDKDNRVYIAPYEYDANAFAYAMCFTNMERFWLHGMGASPDVWEAAKRSVSIGKNGKAYTILRDNEVFCILTNGQIEWQLKLGGIIGYSTITIDGDGNLYVGNYDNNRLHSISPEGKLNWEIQTGGEIWATPVIDLSGRILIGNKDSYMYCFKLNNLPVINNINYDITSSYITFIYDLTELDGDLCSLKLKYSKDGGDTWKDGIMLGKTSGISPGNNKSVKWNYPQNIVNLDNILVKIILNDKYEDNEDCIIRLKDNFAEDLSKVYIYPNVIKNNCQITFFNLTKEAEIKIYNQLGILLNEYKADLKNYNIDICDLDLSTGVYIIVISDKEHSHVTKKILFIK